MAIFRELIQQKTTRVAVHSLHPSTPSGQVTSYLKPVCALNYLTRRGINAKDYCYSASK